MNEPRLAIVLSHPTQYYSPWFRWMRANTTLNFRVFYLSDFGLRAAQDEKFGQAFAWDVDLTSGYDWELVPNLAVKPDTLRYDGLKNPEIYARLSRYAPTAILLFGYKYHTHLRLIAWARVHRLPLIFRGDSHLIGRSRLPLRARLALRFLYAQFAAITYVGSANHDYFRLCGVPERKLFFAPHAVDAARFTAAEPTARVKATALRKELGLTEKIVLLFAGKLIPEKQPRALLDAFLAVNAPDAALVYVGDGVEKTSLQAETQRNPNAPVYFLPFANQSEMPTRYALADLLVLPSRGAYETWGLVVNEAMHLGIPALVSHRVGCQRDLVEDGKTGWVFAAEDPESLRSKLREALSALRNPGQASAVRSHVHDRIASYTYKQTTAGLQAALAIVRK
jgi:glycosyltransferase involved in cell wall biosynthesis